LNFTVKDFLEMKVALAPGQMVAPAPSRLETDRTFFRCKPDGQLTKKLREWAIRPVGRMADIAFYLEAMHQS
jgi:hypothetical protein